MDLFMARTKPRIVMSYRSIGSGAGATEFNASVSAFGCGDIPLPAGIYNGMNAQNMTVLHLPYLVGSVSVFHNVPGVAKGRDGMFLSPCTLAKIFRGAITRWNDSAILADNADNPDLDALLTDEPIVVVHRDKLSSSSTFTLTHFFDKACPEEWTNVTGNASLSRPVGDTTQWPDDGPQWKSVPSSQGMVQQIGSTPFAIGYVESGQGLNAGLKEVLMASRAAAQEGFSSNVKGARLLSSEANIGKVQFLKNTLGLEFSNLEASSWLNVLPVWVENDSEAYQWPMVAITYLYLRADLSFLGEVGGLLKLFCDYLLTDEVAAMLPGLGFQALDADIRNQTRGQLSTTLTVSPASLPWAYEAATNTTFGQANYVVSTKRSSYVYNTVVDLQASDKQTAKTLALGDAFQVHGSGSFVAAPFLRRAMATLQDRARVPVAMSYRAVGSWEAQQEMLDYNLMYSSYNHFKVSDMPLTSAHYGTLNSAAALSATKGVLQVPLSVSALAIYYNKKVPSPLKLDCGLLKDLYFGTSSLAWNDDKLAQLNNYTQVARDTVLNYPMTVYGMAARSSASTALVRYLQVACSFNQPLNTLRPEFLAGVKTTDHNGNAINTPDDMLAAIAATPNSIGYLPYALGRDSGLAEARLWVGGAPGAGGDFRNVGDLQGALDLQGLIAKVNGDHPEVFNATGLDLSPLDGPLYGVQGYWPIPMVQYMFMFVKLDDYYYSGPLLRYFAEFILSDEGAALAKAGGLAPMPVVVRSGALAAVRRCTLRPLTEAWQMEAADAISPIGSSLYTFSANRESYATEQLAALSQSLQELSGLVQGTAGVTLRTACTAAAFPLTHLWQQDMRSMPSVPIRLLDEMVTPQQAIAALSAAPTSAQPTHYILHPGPLDASSWANLSAQGTLLQVPVAIRPVGLLYKGADGLRLSNCTVLDIIGGIVTTWDHASIKADNPNLQLPSNPIEVVHSDDADAKAVFNYLTTYGSKCPNANGKAMPRPPSDAARALDVAGRVKYTMAGKPYSRLALVSSAALPTTEGASQAGVYFAALQSCHSTNFTSPLSAPQYADPSSCPASGCNAAVAELYQQGVDSLAGSGSLQDMHIPDDVTGSWDQLALTGTTMPDSGPDIYPIIRLDFLVTWRDLSPYGQQESGALKALVQYAAADRPQVSERNRASLGPYIMLLGQAAYDKLSREAVESLVASPGAPKWEVLPDSTAAASPDTAATLVLSRSTAYPVFWSYSRSSSSSGSSGSSNGTWAAPGATMSREEVASMVSDKVDAFQSSLADPDKLDLTYDIAVAALVLALVLFVATLVLAVVALRRANEALGRRRGSSDLGNCLTGPSEVKYTSPDAGQHMGVELSPQRSDHV